MADNLAIIDMTKQNLINMKCKSVLGKLKQKCNLPNQHTVQRSRNMTSNRHKTFNKIIHSKMDEITIIREEDEDTENPYEIDPKLLLMPVVCTTKLDQMGLFNHKSFNINNNKPLIDLVNFISNPLKNEINLKSSWKCNIGSVGANDDAIIANDIYDNINQSSEVLIKDDEGVTRVEVLDDGIALTTTEDLQDDYDDDDVDIKTEVLNVDDVELNIDDTQRVKLSSKLFKKPIPSNYNPSDLIKNPDFNSNLNMLSSGFVRSYRNMILMSYLKRLTVDVSNAFETKLVQGRMYLKQDEEITPSNLNAHDTEVMANVKASIANEKACTATPIYNESNDDVECNIIRSDIVGTNISNRTLTDSKEIPVMQSRNTAIHLPDMAEVRAINQKLLTAEVSPIQTQDNLNKTPVVASAISPNTKIIIKPVEIPNSKSVNKNVAKTVNRQLLVMSKEIDKSNIPLPVTNAIKSDPSKFISNVNSQQKTASIASSAEAVTDCKCKYIYLKVMKTPEGHAIRKFGNCQLHKLDRHPGETVSYENTGQIKEINSGNTVYAINVKNVIAEPTNIELSQQMARNRTIDDNDNNKNVRLKMFQSIDHLMDANNFNTPGSAKISPLDNINKMPQSQVEEIVMVYKPLTVAVNNKSKPLNMNIPLSRNTRTARNIHIPVKKFNSTEKPQDDKIPQDPKQLTDSTAANNAIPLLTTQSLTTTHNVKNSVAQNLLIINNLEKAIAQNSTATNNAKTPIVHSSATTHNVEKPIAGSSSITNNVKKHVAQISTATNNVKTPITHRSTTTYNVKTPITHRSTTTYNVKKPVGQHSTISNNDKKFIAQISTIAKNVNKTKAHKSTAVNQIKKSRSAKVSQPHAKQTNVSINKSTNVEEYQIIMGNTNPTNPHILMPSSFLVLPNGQLSHLDSTAYLNYPSVLYNGVNQTNSILIQSQPTNLQNNISNVQKDNVITVIVNNPSEYITKPLPPIPSSNTAVTNTAFVSSDPGTFGSNYIPPPLSTLRQLEPLNATNSVLYKLLTTSDITPTKGITINEHQLKSVNVVTPVPVENDLINNVENQTLTNIQPSDVPVVASKNTAVPRKRGSVARKPGAVDRENLITIALKPTKLKKIVVRKSKVSKDQMSNPKVMNGENELTIITDERNISMDDCDDVKIINSNKVRKSKSRKRLSELTELHYCGQPLSKNKKTIIHQEIINLDSEESLETVHHDTARSENASTSSKWVILGL